MRWLIDGYNVIRRDPELRGREAESLEAGRTALLQRLAAAARRSRDDFTVVFDGARVTGGSAGAGRVQALFSRPPRTADDELMRLARQLGPGGIVVTSDRTIQDAARRARCPVLTSEQFLEGLTVVAGPARSACSEGGPPEVRWGSDSADDRRGDPMDDRPPVKRGNPRRLSKKARAAARALRRLRPS